MRATPTPLLREATFGLGWQFYALKLPLKDGVSPILTMILMQRSTSSKLMFLFCASPWGVSVSMWPSTSLHTLADAFISY